MSELIEINLLPVEERKIKKDYSYLLDTKIVVPSLVVLITLLAYLIGISTIHSDLKDNKEKLASIEADIKANKKILSQIKKLERLLQEKNAKNRSLKSISFNKQVWVRILEGLSKTVPPHTWIKEIKQENEQAGDLLLIGTSHLFSEVAVYMIALEKDNYFLNVSLDKIQVDGSIKPDAFIFTLKIKVNLNLGAERPSARVADVVS
ncbi:PilN domain-containing protein [Fibrobacterota bacterium]